MAAKQSCTAAISAGILAFACGAAAQTVIVNTGGFEGFGLGDLNGQQGWTTYIDANGRGLSPAVVDATGGNHVIGAKAVRLEVPDAQNAQSGMEYAVSDLRAQGYTRITVSFDIYRQSSLWATNLWWYWFDSGDPTYGLMWDVGAAATSEVWGFGFQGATPHPPVAFDQYASLSMTWDFTTGMATGTYNGIQLAPFAIANIGTLTGWGIVLQHDEATGSGPEVAWIDNFRITGERPCYANCDGSTIAPILNVNDFICFQTKYAQGDSNANCDGSTIPPVLNVNDFICFQTRYAAGCP